MSNYVKVFRGHDVPNWATHYGPDTEKHHGGWYMANKVSGKAKFRRIGSTQWSSNCYRIPDSVIPLPEEPMPPKAEWMPKVGEECEALDTLMAHPVYCLAKIKGFYDNQVWVTSEAGVDLVLNIRDVRFRPLKTAEEKKREAFIDCVMGGVSGDSKNAHIVYNVAEQLFNAGFTAPKGEL